MAALDLETEKQAHALESRVVGLSSQQMTVDSPCGSADNQSSSSQPQKDMQPVAVRLLRDVAASGNAASLAGLKEAITDTEAATAAAQQILNTLDASKSPPQQVQGCRMVRAMCLAGGIQSVVSVGAHMRLLQMLTTHPAEGSVLTPAAEALVSCAVRSRLVAAAVAEAPAEQLKRLVQRLSLPADAHGGAAAAAAALVHSLLRLVNNLLNHPSALPALLSAGVLPAVVQLVPKPDQLPAASQPADKASQQPRQSHTEHSGEEASQPAQVKSVAARNPYFSVHTSAVQLLLSLSQYHQLHGHLAAAGAVKQLVPLLSRQTPAALLEPAVAAVANLAHGSTTSQRALLSAGAVAQLVPLLAAGQLDVVCSAVDALANLMLSQPAAQRQLCAATCSWPGIPSAVGKQQVSGASGTPRPAVAGGVASLVRLLHTANPAVVAKVLRCLSNAVLACSVNQTALLATGVFPALVGLTTCGVPPVERQAVGLITNLLPGCEAAQAAAIAGSLPAICAQLLSRTAATSTSNHADDSSASTQQPQQGLNSKGDGQPVTDELMERTCLLVANIAGGGAEGKAALVAGGVLPPLVKLMQQGTTTQHAQPKELGLQQAQQHNQANDGSGQPVGTGHTQEHGQETSQQTEQLAQQAARQQLRIVAAAASAVSNLALNSPDISQQLLKCDITRLLISLLAQPDQEWEVLSRVAHALGSLVLNNEAAKQNAMADGVDKVLRNLITDNSQLASNTAEAQEVHRRTSVQAVCWRAVGHLALGSPSIQTQLVDLVPDCVAAIQGSSEEVVKSALGALTGLTQGCTAAQVKFMSVPGASEALMRAAAAHPATQHAVCACIHALTLAPASSTITTPLDTLDVCVTDVSQQDVVSQSVVSLPPELQSEAACAVVHQVQDALAQAGIIPMLVRMLGSHNADVVDGAAMALCAMVSGNRNVQKQTAADGGVAALSKVMDRLSTAPQPRPALTRHVVDAWLELGGATAAVKLLHHAQPAVVECACRRIASGVLVLSGRVPARSARVGGTTNGQRRNSSSGGGSDSQQQPDGTAQSQLQSCGWLVGGAAGGVTPGDAAGTQALAALLKAGAPAALLQACRTGTQARALAAVLVALRALVEVGGTAVRTVLLQAGAAKSLQTLQLAAVTAAASKGPAGTGPRPTSAPPVQANTSTTNLKGKALAARSPSSGITATGTRGAIRSAAGVTAPANGKGQAASKPAAGNVAQVAAPRLAQKSSVTSPGITALHVAQLCEQLCAQLLV